MNFFQRVRTAIFNVEKYNDFALEKTQVAVKYFLKLLLVLVIIISFASVYKFGTMANFFIETFKEQLKSHKCKKEFNNLEPQYQVIREMIKAREEKNMTQVELSKLTGISQADISRLENGEANPTIEMLNRIAYAFGKKLELQFA